MKKTDNLSSKVILSFAIAAVSLLGYATAAQGADSLEGNEGGAIVILDPFTLTLSSTTLSSTTSLASKEGPNDHANDRAKIMVPYRGPKRSPIKPPWP